MNPNATPALSILVKTFERKWSLTRLLRSLKKIGCPYPILIADDSRQPYREEILAQFPPLDIHYYELPFDTGLAVGRNFLLEKVNTPYLLLCDDDFVFDDKLAIPAVISLMEKNSLDIAGGILFNHITVTGIKRFFSVMTTPRTAFQYIFNIPVISRYTGVFSIDKNQCTLAVTNRKHETPVYACDLVNNFFIAKTGSIRKIEGWDAHFKVGEHEDFFYRARLAGFKIALVEQLSAHHYPGARNNYLAYRERAFELKKRFPKKFSFTRYTEINTDTNTVLFSYPEGEA